MILLYGRCPKRTIVLLEETYRHTDLFHSRCRCRSHLRQCCSKAICEAPSICDPYRITNRNNGICGGSRGRDGVRGGSHGGHGRNNGIRGGSRGRDGVRGGSRGGRGSHGVCGGSHGSHGSHTTFVIQT